ncbi:MAG: cobaltochelatase subunit CobN [Cyanobacteria bacterium J06634_6]
MHRLAATPGGWTAEAEGVIVIQQSPAPIVYLTAADTDISALSQAVTRLPDTFADIRSVNLLQLKQQLTIDTYAEDVLAAARLIVIRVLGGRAYWSYGLEVVKATAESTGAALVILPGDDRPDLDLMSHSTVPLTVVNRLWQYLVEGGVDNLRNGLLYISNTVLNTDYLLSPPQTISKSGIYTFLKDDTQQISTKQLVTLDSPNLTKGARVGILFYRAHFLAGNTQVIDAIAQALTARHLTSVPIYVSSLKDVDIQQALIRYCQPQSSDQHPDKDPIELIINTTSFAITSLNQQQSAKHSRSKPQHKTLWQQLDVPVLQVICSGSPREQWQRHPQGLTPRDIAMNVALPEVDGRIITRAVSFKSAQSVQSQGKKTLQTDVVTYEPESDRIHFVTDLALHWIQLRRTPPPQRKVALVLANYPNRDGRMANGVGLDTPASCLNILRSLKKQGYSVGDLPKTGDELMARLAAGVTNDPEGFGLRPALQSLDLASYQTFLGTLPTAVREGITARWGEPDDEWQRFGQGPLPISGIQFGNVFVGIQPSRGYDIDPRLNYHAPDLEPTHAYMGFYYWLRDRFGAQAIVHVGKHGNLEWLPGKGIALSQNCYPEAAFGAMPHFYPFIVNDPGEGAQAKRRSQAVILDHLTPPMTRAELYGPLQQLEGLVDEYYEAQNLDPTRLKIIGPKILTLLENTQLRIDLSLSTVQAPSDLQSWLPQIDGYLCELKEAQIRDGLHSYGECPQGEQLRDLVVAIARHPNRVHEGLLSAIADDWDIDIEPFTDELSNPWQQTHSKTKGCRTVGDVVERLEDNAAALVADLIKSADSPETVEIATTDKLRAVIDWILFTLLPNLRQTTDEIDYLLHGLNGGYIPSGPSGAPTRNRPEVLPTGRNFYSVDIRAIPTESAWDVGRKAAEQVIENYTQEQGEYPRTLGLSMWGTSAMRTGGDDIAEALALLGVQPVWDGPSRRVTDFEILPLSVLGRPRVDVTLRISGFFRDAFPNLISLFDQAVIAVAALNEPPEQNPLAAQVQKDFDYWQKQGLDDVQSGERSRYRIFGSKPGAYGAGLQGLIEAQNWKSDADLARAYINWSSYAYVGGKSGQPDGHSAPESFSQRLENMQIVLQNQDNREHDLLDSDDYYQFQGGLTAAVKAKRGEAPKTYFGDNAVPERPRVRSLASEVARVYRSRVVNPKWIKGVMRHGYKGAFEMAATVDYLFAYDATTGCVADHMYTGVAEAYVFDSEVRQFVEKSNPWALRDMAERLLEAKQRGLWEEASEEMVDGLRAIAHEAEGKIEAGLSNNL